MANTLAHLAVAQRVLSARPQLVTFTNEYYQGTIAPDTIESKAGAVRDDKKHVHLLNNKRKNENNLKMNIITNTKNIKFNYFREKNKLNPRFCVL